jgi:hypothetical protein
LKLIVFEGPTIGCTNFWVESSEVQGPGIQLIPSLDRMPILAKHPFFVTRANENVRMWEVFGCGRKAIFSREGTSDPILSHSIGKSWRQRQSLVSSFLHTLIFAAAALLPGSFQHATNSI